MASNYREKLPKWFIILLSAIIPGSGHVLLGRPMRGFFFLMWIFAFGYITGHLSSGQISAIGRYAGGLAVWVLSILEVNKLTKTRLTKI